MSRYNGWTNWETWVASMWLDKYILDTQYDGLRIMPDDLEAHVDTLYDEVQDSLNGMFRDMLSACLHEINYQEIADRANEGVE